jgi:hypothetical protein
MSLERKDVRFKIAPDMHGALTVLAEVADVDIGEYVEMIVQREVLRRVHEAQSITAKTSRLGLTGNERDSAGKIRE